MCNLQNAETFFFFRIFYITRFYLCPCLFQDTHCFPMTKVICIFVVTFLSHFELDLLVVRACIILSGFFSLLHQSTNVGN